MPDNTCDRCGREAELFHNEASGLAYCDECETATTTEQPTGFHAELARVIEHGEHAEPGSIEAQLREQALSLYVLPEASIEALVQAAQSGVRAVRIAHFGPNAE